jgi:MFS family permease
MSTTAPQLGFREVLQLKPVRRLWLAQLVSIFGDFLALFAVLSAVTFRWHGTATEVTFLTLAYMLPFAFVGPLAGVFVDRWNVKRTMIASDLSRAVLALTLVFVTDLAQVYAVLFLLSVVSSFFMPAQTVTLRTIVPAEGLLAANGLMQQAFQLTRIVSPTAAGALVSWLGESACYYLDGVSFIFSAAMIATIIIQRAVTPSASDGGKVKTVVTELSAGMKFIFTHAAISFVIISMAAGMFAISCFSPLFAVYVRDTLKATPLLFGIISSLVGVGMIVGMPLITKLARTRSKSHLVISGLFAIGVSVYLLAAFGSVPVAALATLGMGVGVAFIMVPSQTLMQQETPMEMIGRVSSSVMSVLCIAQVIGLIFSGSLAHWLGIKNLFYTSAGLLALIAAVGFFFLQRQSSQSPESALEGVP